MHAHDIKENHESAPPPYLHGLNAPQMEAVEATEGPVLVLAPSGNGLDRAQGTRVYVMCEIPSNVILAEDFLKVFDGFSIGTNDLTQLMLGVDRDSELVAHVYDERNEAVKRMVKWVIETSNSKDKYIGICGQAPSDYLEFAEFVVESGIQTMSLNPDTIIKTTLAIAELEKKMGISPQ